MICNTVRPFLSRKLALSSGRHEGLIYSLCIVFFVVFFSHSLKGVNLTFKSFEAFFAPLFLILIDHIPDIKFTECRQVYRFLGEAYFQHPLMQSLLHILFSFGKQEADLLGILARLG